MQHAAEGPVEADESAVEPIEEEHSENTAAESEEKPVDEPKEQDEEPKEENVKSGYSKAIVFLCLVTIIAFTVTCFVYMWHNKPLNDTLTVLFFGCFGLEFASLAFIKGRKIRYSEGNAGNKKMPSVSINLNDNTKGERE